MTMPYRSNRRRGMSLRPVNRIKHVVDGQFATGAGAGITANLILSTDTPVLANTTECETGSTVNGIYLKVEAIATSSAALPNLYMSIQKNPGGNLGVVAPNAVGANDDKRYVIHQEMLMFQKQTNSNPRTLFNGVIVIPRGYRRNGPNDKLQLRILSPGVAIEFCFQCHYKEFR